MIYRPNKMSELLMRLLLLVLALLLVSCVCTRYIQFQWRIPGKLFVHRYADYHYNRSMIENFGNDRRARLTTTGPPQTNYLNLSGERLQTVNVSSLHSEQDTRIYPQWMQELVSKLFEEKPIVKDELEKYYKLIKNEIPQGSWPPYDYGPLKEILKPAYKAATEENLKVPNIIHFTWFYKKNGATEKPIEMNFYQMISIVAAYKKIQPYKILFWHDVLPVGEWWDYTVKHVPNLLMVYRETPTTIFKTTFGFPEHKSDIVRLEAVLILGGIYFDLDSVALNSFEPLRKYSAVQGAENFKSLANGVIIAEPNNIFHWLFYLCYYKYDPKEFASNSVLRGMNLAKEYSDLIKVEFAYILRPNTPERLYLYEGGWLWDWSKHYCVHLYARFNTKEFDSKSLNRSNNVIGEIYRYILYDQTIPNIHKRPSLFQMSYWHHNNCKDKGFPKGTWDCEHDAKIFMILKNTYNFREI